MYKRQDVSNPTMAQATRQTMGLVMPLITTNRGKSNAHCSTEPLTTQSCMINHGIVTPEAKNSFISYYNRTSQVSHITEPADTQPTSDRMSLITNVTPRIEDCYYRMIKPPEVKLAMAFDKDYTILGNGKEQVLQCGNAVTPPAMEWLFKQSVASLS
nr:DNA cytosine methyltransferase [Pedobacter sp. ASV19]